MLFYKLKFSLSQLFNQKKQKNDFHLLLEDRIKMKTLMKGKKKTKLRIASLLENEVGLSIEFDHMNGIAAFIEFNNIHIRLNQQNPPAAWFIKIFLCSWVR